MAAPFFECITHVQAGNDTVSVAIWFDEVSGPELIKTIQASIDKAEAKQAVIDAAKAEALDHELNG